MKHKFVILVPVYVV